MAMEKPHSDRETGHKHRQIGYIGNRLFIKYLISLSPLPFSLLPSYLLREIFPKKRLTIFIVSRWQNTSIMRTMFGLEDLRNETE